MKKFALLSATALLLVACAASEVQFPGVSTSPVLNISNSSGSFVGKKVKRFKPFSIQEINSNFEYSRKGILRRFGALFHLQLISYP